MNSNISSENKIFSYHICKYGESYIDNISELEIVMTILENGNYEDMKSKHELSIKNALNGLLNDFDERRSLNKDNQIEWISYHRPIILMYYRRIVIIKLNLQCNRLTKRRILLRNRIIQSMFEGFYLLITKIEELDF